MVLAQWGRLYKIPHGPGSWVLLWGILRCFSKGILANGLDPDVEFALSQGLSFILRSRRSLEGKEVFHAGIQGRGEIQHNRDRGIEPAFFDRNDALAGDSDLLGQRCLGQTADFAPISDVVAEDGVSHV